jgi:glycosyltransferase involved in cell wall biosynthesis
MLFEKENLRSAKLFHATSVSEAESIEKNLSFTVTFTFTKPRIVVAPNGVEIPQRIPKREVVEEKFPELKGRRWVLFMSRIHPKKGLDVLLEAWRQQQRDGRLRLPLRLRDGQEVEQETVLVIAGADLIGYGAEVERMIREKGLGETVLMTGHVDGEVREALLGHAEFLVLPSHSENFGLVVAESLAAGRPVVTTNKTPWGSELAQGDRRKEIADRGSMNLELRGCGVICEVTDLKRGLERMLEFSDKEREEMGARGREWMKEEFSWEAAAETILEAYKAIAGK